jgi:hypothetical protein
MSEKKFNTMGGMLAKPTCDNWLIPKKNISRCVMLGNPTPQAQHAHLLCLEGVEACCWLIQEQQAGAADQLTADSQTLLLTT